MKEILVESSVDKTKQPSLFYEEKGKRPLLVGLHTWSFDRYNQKDNLLPVAKKLKWNLLLPEFRGPNTDSNSNCTLACGSYTAINDIIDAVNYVKNEYDIDDNNIYLLGASGGGHAALLTAAFNPYLWKAVCAFVPICDLKKWYYEKKKEKSCYADHIFACVGGYTPKANLNVYKIRSPINYIDNLAKANLKIFHGKNDTVVSYKHSLMLYNSIVKKYPNSKTYLDIFDGSHEMLIDLAVSFFLKQSSESINVTG